MRGTTGKNGHAMHPAESLPISHVFNTDHDDTIACAGKECPPTSMGPAWCGGTSQGNDLLLFEHGINKDDVNDDHHDTNGSILRADGLGDWQQQQQRPRSKADVRCEDLLLATTRSTRREERCLGILWNGTKCIFRSMSSRCFCKCYHCAWRTDCQMTGTFDGGVRFTIDHECLYLSALCYSSQNVGCLARVRSRPLSPTIAKPCCWLQSVNDVEVAPKLPSTTFLICPYFTLTLRFAPPTPSFDA